MSSMTSSPRSLDDVTGLEPLRAKSGWIVALGAVYIVAGIIALGSVVLATVATVFVVGIMMVIAGVAEVINAFQIKTWGRFLLWLLLGALYIAAGFITFENPLLAAAILTASVPFDSSSYCREAAKASWAFGLKWSSPSPAQSVSSFSCRCSS